MTVETLDGNLNIEVKPGTNSGQQFVLKNLGMPPFQPPDNYDVNKLRGDHIIKFKVVIPSNLNQQQKEIIEEFQRHE